MSLPSSHNIKKKKKKKYDYLGSSNNYYYSQQQNGKDEEEVSRMDVVPMSIPRKPKKIPKITISTTGVSSKGVSSSSSVPWVISERPRFVLRIPQSNIVYPRAKRLIKKRKSYNYEEDDINGLLDTDDDGNDDDINGNEATTSGEHRNANKKKKKKMKKMKTKSSSLTAAATMMTPSGNNNGSTTSNSSSHHRLPRSASNANNNNIQNNSSSSDVDESGHVKMSNDQFLHMDPNSTESPPPGVLNCLWYSRECVSHIWVVEKVLGWKSRPITKLRYADSNQRNDDDDDDASMNSHGEPVETTKKKMSTEEVMLREKEEWIQTKLREQGTLDTATALSYHDHVLAITAPHVRARHEVSRINASACPMVLRYAAKIESAGGTNPTPKYIIQTTAQYPSTEEVYFVKWRGRSYWHCSWERKKDLEKMDPQAKVKLKRFLQLQELTLGKQWKQQLLQYQLEQQKQQQQKQLNDDATAAAIVADKQESIDKNNQKTKNDSNLNLAVDGAEEEEYFSPDLIEPDRILACDETELNMQVLSIQRALNLRAEEEALQNRSNNNNNNNNNNITTFNPAGTLFDKVHLKKYVEDPEDNVRYIVKWKGQAFADVTWEYWRDIKYDAVEAAEDYWYCQRPPPLEPPLPHPHMRDYKKLNSSPIFGISNKARPIATLPNSTNTIDSSNTNNSDSKDDSLALRLRAYQLEGVNWLLWNWWNQRSCILADEMGLGKTIQTLCFLDQLHRLSTTQVRGPFLVVAPLSLVNQWQSEAMIWTPDFNVVLYHGSADARDFLVQQEFYYKEPFVHPKSLVSKYKRQNITKFHILITTYEVVLKDLTVLSKIKWRALIVDEAHRLKNNKSRLFVDLLNVPRDFCLLLTGTPLQNSTEELWALLHFSDPTNFANKEEFVDKFGQLTDAEQVSDLHSILKPYLLRRVKEDVEKSLPPKEETILEVTLTPIQKTYYKAIYEKNTKFLFKGTKSSNAPSLMNVMMELRKCCNHPFLIKGAEERIMADALIQESKQLKQKEEEDTPQSQDPFLVLHRRFTQQLIKSSGKMVLMEKLLPKLQDGGHKVLIFSQMVRVLDLLEEFLRYKQYKYERLDGSTGSSARAAAVDRFNRKSFQRFVMLLSTRAGGLGLNLTSADTVIIFDSDWNPQNDLQAMARAHRIGQTRAVSVYRLLTNKTYEMHMFHSASMKLGLDRAVLAHQRQQGDEDDEGKKKSKSKSEKEIQAKEIDELLKKGAYDVFRDEDDSEAKKFMDTDIDHILERSARKVTYGNTESRISSGLGSFSKASFVTADADGNDVDLDDPDFWAKAVGLEAPVESSVDKNLLLDGGKRSRKQVQVFDPYASYAEAEKKKQDKIAQKEREEKEEKERLRSLKKKKNNDDKDKKNNQKDNNDNSKSKKSGSTSSGKKKDRDQDRSKKKRRDKEGKSKKARKAERRNAARKAEREDPVIEQIKQGWESLQRNRAISAILKFGFGRFCKIRNEANLTSIPTQDLEIFTRAYVYMLGLQASVSFLVMTYESFSAKPLAENEISDLCESNYLKMFEELRFESGHYEWEWVLDAMKCSLKFHIDIRNRKRTVRIPKTLTESAFVAELRSGVAFRVLQRLAFLAKFNVLIEGALDKVLEALGNEELGKRGCPTKDLTTLDTDLKARHVTSEELCYALGEQLSECLDESKGEQKPSTWWDRSCDLGLLVGTFTHGLGNYEAMVKDNELPFGSKTKKFIRQSQNGEKSFKTLSIATNAVKKSLESFSSILESKVTQKNESGTCTNDDDKTANEESNSNTKTLTGTDSLSETGPLTLSIFSTSVQKEIFEQIISGLDYDDKSTYISHQLVMPDAKCLNRHLHFLLDSFYEYNSDSFTKKNSSCLLTNNGSLVSEDYMEVIKSNLNVIDKAKSLIYAGKGILSNDSNSNNGVDFSISDTTENLLDVTNTQGLSKQLIGLGLPYSFSRYSISAIVHSDHRSLNKVTEVEKKVEAEYLEKTQSAKDENLKEKEQIKETNHSDQSDVDRKIYTLDMRTFFYDSRFLPSNIRHRPVDRASICAALLYFGSPVNMDRDKSRQVNISLKNICYPGNEDFDYGLFDISKFLKFTNELAGKDVLIQEDEVRKYIQHILIPHCVRLCLNGCKSKEKISHLTKFGKISKGFKHNVFTSLKSSLPDPFVSLVNHSDESVLYASAILRRVRLSRSIRCIIGDGVPGDKIETFLRSDTMRSFMEEMPIWWCPWIHDLALMVHAAKFGLFAIVNDVKKENTLDQLNSVFSHKNIYKNVKIILVDGSGDQKPLLPKHILSRMSQQDFECLLEFHTNQFPSVTLIEHRLTFICAMMTQNQAIPNDKNNFYCRYFDIPLFDHHNVI